MCADAPLYGLVELNSVLTPPSIVARHRVYSVVKRGVEGGTSGSGFCFRVRVRFSQFILNSVSVNLVENIY